MDSNDSVNNYNMNITGDTSDIDDYSNADPSGYFGNISLCYFAASPVEMLNEHEKFMELCLEHSNPEAHYIKGILQCFIFEKIQKGLYHLRKSAELHNDNGTYLYGLVSLLLGHYHRGKKFMNKLHWKENLSTSDLCWERIKNSLRGISITMTDVYYGNMINMAPQIDCHPGDNMTLVCENCYYYKRVKLFYQYITKDD